MLVQLGLVQQVLQLDPDFEQVLLGLGNLNLRPEAGQREVARWGWQPKVVVDHWSSQTPVLGMPWHRKHVREDSVVLDRLLELPAAQGGKRIPQVPVFPPCRGHRLHKGAKVRTANGIASEITVVSIVNSLGRASSSEFEIGAVPGTDVKSVKRAKTEAKQRLRGFGMKHSLPLKFFSDTRL